MKQLLIMLLLLPLGVFAQRHKAEINFNAAGDQQMSLGRYRSGNAIRIESQISGSYAEDGGIYHIVGDWAGVPKVIYRGESSISTRLKFYGYVDPASNGYAFLFATWDNASLGESSTNDVKFTIYSEGNFDINDPGVFANASELENILIVQSTTGNVGIGTTNLDSKLTVNGTIHTKEVKVDLNGWPDFVFEPEFQLRTLREVEGFISRNKHLPEIPSAVEVAENGIQLGEMNAKLLQKIEELTLYVIQQSKEIEKLNERIEDLEKEL